MDSLIEELLRFYKSFDKFQDNYMSDDNARELYQSLIDNNCIDYVAEGDKLLGYVESFRIDYETFGKIICGINPYKHLDELEISNGQIAYCANITIDPAYRKTNVIKLLTSMFFKRNIKCDYFVGQAWRKKHRPIKVFNKQEAFKKFIRS